MRVSSKSGRKKTDDTIQASGRTAVGQLRSEPTTPSQSQLCLVIGYYFIHPEEIKQHYRYVIDVMRYRCGMAVMSSRCRGNVAEMSNCDADLIFM